MTLADINDVSQIVGVVVIVLTLFAILWQGYQTNKIARAELTLSMWMQGGAMNQAVVDSTDKAAFMTRVFDPAATLSREDMVRINFQMYTQIGVFQAAYMLRNRGLIEASAYDLSAAGARAFMQSKVARNWWRAHRAEGYPQGFQSMVDAMVRDMEAAAPRPAAAAGPN